MLAYEISTCYFLSRLFGRIGIRIGSRRLKSSGEKNRNNARNWEGCAGQLVIHIGPDVERVQQSVARWGSAKGPEGKLSSVSSALPSIADGATGWLHCLVR